MLAGVFLAGILIGTCLVRANADGWNGFIRELFTGFASARSHQSFAETFWYAFGSSALFLGLIFLSGFCAVGSPFVFLILLFRGVGYGLTAGSVYSIFGLGGIGYVAAMLLPGCVLGSFALLKGGQSAIRCSSGVYSSMKGPAPMNPRPYYRIFFLLGIYLLAVSFFEAVFCCVFRGFFVHMI